MGHGEVHDGLASIGVVDGAKIKTDAEKQQQTGEESVDVAVKQVTPGCTCALRNSFSCREKRRATVEFVYIR